MKDKENGILILAPELGIRELNCVSSSVLFSSFPPPKQHNLWPWPRESNCLLLRWKQKACVFRCGPDLDPGQNEAQ